MGQEKIMTYSKTCEHSRQKSTDMRLKIDSRQQRRGVAAVELALLLPLILLLLMGLWEIGRAIDVQQLMSNAAREGGRQASTGMAAVPD